MWRGIMLNRGVRHFLEDVRWGDLDYLLIDMPPGTGDVQMGVAKMLPRAEGVIRSDAQPRRSPLPRGRAVGRPRLPADRHAPWHRRRADGRGQDASPCRGRD